MKRFIALFLAVSLIFIVTGCGGSSGTSGSTGGSAGASASPSGETYTVKLAHQATESNPWQWSALEFKKLVEERTNGGVQVEVYFGGTLGYDRDLIEGMQAGTVDLAFVTTAPLASFVSSIGVLDLPYVMHDWDDLEKFVESEPAQQLSDKIGENSLVNICFYPQGFRQATNNLRPIAGIDDLKGMKMRVMQSDVFIETFTALGASPVPMSWSEVPTSLQQGTIDGQENGIITNYSNNIWEYQKYMSLTAHCAYMTTFLGSKKLIEKLPAEYQNIVMEAGKEAVVYGMKRIQEEEGSILDEIKGKGMAINDVDTADMIAATTTVRDAFAQKNPDAKGILEGVMALAD